MDVKQQFRLSLAALVSVLDSDRAIHSVKTALACLVGFILIKLVHLPLDQWLLITIIVVMCAQVNVGSVIGKAYMRFLGTFIGSLIAALTLGILGDSFFAIVSVASISVIFFSYIATSNANYSDSGTLGAVTVIIILFGQNPSMSTAAHRFFEISFGIFIATIVSQFVFPIQARDHLRSMEAKTLIQMREYYLATLITTPAAQTTVDYLDVDEAIVKSLSQQRSLAKQAVKEPFGIAFDPTQFNKSLQAEKEIFRSIVYMHYAIDMLPANKKYIAELVAIQHFHQSVCQSLETLAARIENPAPRQTPIVIPSLQPLKEAILAISKTLSSDDLVYLNGFLFCADLLILQLTELVVLCGLA